jgi:hypothetical protein
VTATGWLNPIKNEGKTMKTLRALMLVLVLSACTYAGNMPCDIVTPPPPSPSAPEAAGQIETGDTDIVTEITLNFLQSVLSLI